RALVGGEGVAAQLRLLLGHDLAVGLGDLLVGAAGRQAVQPGLLGAAAGHQLPVEDRVDDPGAADERLELGGGAQRAVQIEVGADDGGVVQLVGGGVDLGVLGQVVEQAADVGVGYRADHRVGGHGGAVGHGNAG